MTDNLLPPNLIPNEVEWSVIDGTGVGQSPTTLATRTATAYGNRVLGCRMTFRDLSDRDRAQIMAMIQRGRADRYWLTDVSTPTAGSVAAPELLSNGTFANGTTGWTDGGGTGITLTATDKILRSTRNSNSSNTILPTAAATVIQYAAYLFRAFLIAGRGPLGFDLRIGSTSGGTDYAQSSGVQTTAGLSSLAAVPRSTTAWAGVGDYADGKIARDYTSIPFLSFARIGMADNGLNALLQSDALDNAAWSKTGCSVSANAGTAPDATSTADNIIEDSSTGNHVISQSAVRASAAEDLCAYGYFRRAGAGNRDITLRVDDGGGNGGSCTFDLALGVAGAASSSGTGSNARAFIVAVGDSTYFCTTIARCPASTTMRTLAYMDNGGISYTGNGTAGLRSWGLGCARTSVPTRGAHTTTTALASGATQQGSGIYIKGLTAGISGFLKLGDLVEINGELKRTTASLDSDAAGLGYLQVEPQMRTPTVDNAPVIFQRPMGKFMLANERTDWSSKPGALAKNRSDFMLEFVEAFS